jgi:hypothetical protein
MAAKASRRLSSPAVGVLALAGIVAGAGGARAVPLDDAVSIVSMACASVDGPTGTFAEPVEYRCSGQSVTSNAMGTTEALEATDFATDSVRVSSDCTACPIETSTRSASRISSELVIARLADPPVAVGSVPVRIDTAGTAEVSELGMLAGAGTYVSSTQQLIFTQADVFGVTALTYSAGGGFSPRLDDSYTQSETLDLAPGHVYFVNVSSGCNNSRSGSWVCSADAQASFVFDQAAFDARMGASSFALSQYFGLQSSPNLAPEPSAALLDLVAIGVLAGLARSGR